MALSESGPYLMAALICERVIQDQDGVITIVRAVDRINVNAAPLPMPAPQVMPPDAMPVIGINNLTLYVALKSGAAKGRETLGVQLEQPNGVKQPAKQMSVLFEGEGDRGVNIMMQLNLMLNIEGLYWFNLTLENQFLGRVPLRVVYNRQGLVL